MKQLKITVNGKAYEMTSCIEGLLELYRENGNQEYLDIAEKYCQDIINCEMMITGTAGGRDHIGEYWFNCREKQCDLLLLAGDVFDGLQVHPETVEEVAQAEEKK